MIILNVYVPNNRTSKYMKQKADITEREIDKSTGALGDFNSPVSNWKIKHVNKDIAYLNNTINQLNVIDIYRILYPTIAEYMLFSSSYGKFSNIDHI